MRLAQPACLPAPASRTPIRPATMAAKRLRPPGLVGARQPAAVRGRRSLSARLLRGRTGRVALAAWFCATGAIAGSAQTTSPTEIGLESATPSPADGHDYLHGLQETVSPSSGTVSLRLGVTLPTGRGLSLPFNFAYDAGAVINDFYRGYGYLNRDGWSFTVPRATMGPQRQATDGSGDVCDLAGGFVFWDASGDAQPLELGPAFAESGYCANLGINDVTQSVVAGGVATTSDLAFGNPTTFVDASGTTYYFPVANTAAATITDRNGNVIAINDGGERQDYIH